MQGATLPDVETIGSRRCRHQRRQWRIARSRTNKLGVRIFCGGGQPLALSGHSILYCQCPFPGVMRTSKWRVFTSVFDPMRTSAGSLQCMGSVVIWMMFAIAPTLLRFGAELPTACQPTMHKYSIGQCVCFEGPFRYNPARGLYKIVSLVPIEKGNKVVYRIKNPAEAFERTAEEYQLTLAPA